MNTGEESAGAAKRVPPLHSLSLLESKALVKDDKTELASMQGNFVS